MIFKNYAQFTDCISEINNKQIDDVKNMDVKMNTYDLNDLIEYRLFTNVWNFMTILQNSTSSR